MSYTTRYDQSLLRGIAPEPLYCPECRCDADDCQDVEGHQDEWQTETERARDEAADYADHQYDDLCMEED